MIEHVLTALVAGVAGFALALAVVLWMTEPYDEPSRSTPTVTYDLDLPATTVPSRAACLERAARAGLTGWCP